jgi:hypothetical protein
MIRMALHLGRARHRPHGNSGNTSAKVLPGQDRGHVGRRHLPNAGSYLGTNEIWTLNGRATRDMSLRSRSTTMTLQRALCGIAQHLGLIGIAVVYTSRSVPSYQPAAAPASDLQRSSQKNNS